MARYVSEEGDTKMLEVFVRWSLDVDQVSIVKGLESKVNKSDF